MVAGWKTIEFCSQWPVIRGPRKRTGFQQICVSGIKRTALIWQEVVAARIMLYQSGVISI